MKNRTRALAAVAAMFAGLSLSGCNLLQPPVKDPFPGGSHSGQAQCVRAPCP